MIRTLFYTLCILCCILTGQVRANLHPGPRQFGLQGELLLLRPCTTAFTFAAELVEFTSTDFTVKSLFNENRYKLGYRVEGAYAFDAYHNVHSRFTYFNSARNPRSADATFIFPASFTGNVKDNNKFRYYAIELLFGRWLLDYCSFDLELQGGILYSNIKYNETTIISGPTTPEGTRLVQSRFWGVGPEIAINFQYKLPLRVCGLFAIAADGRAALLTSESKFSFVNVNFGSLELTGPSLLFGSDPGFAVLNEPLHAVVPAADLRMGLNWAFLCRCLRLNLEAGYEWIFYHRAFGASNISFRGPYFVLGIDY